MSAAIASASSTKRVSFEALHDGDLLADELLAPGVLAGVYVSAAAPAARGAWPLGVVDLYPIDDAHLAHYARLARTREGFDAYLDEFVWRTTPAKNSSPAASRA